jgi:hypothetical protein
VRRAAVTFTFAGAAIRLVALAAAWNRPPVPDLVAYLHDAADRSLAHAWAAGKPEPLWIWTVKAVSWPAGYSAHAAQAFTMIISIATIWFAWRLLRDVVGDAAALFTCAIVAFHPLAVIDAIGGLREPIAMLLVIAAVSLLLGERSPARAGGAGAAIAGLAAIRWELGVALFLVALAVVAVRRAEWVVIVVALALGGLLIGPYLVANAERYGDPFYRSNLHARYYSNIDLALRSGRNPYGDDVDRYQGDATWRSYYLEDVPPTLLAARLVDGAIRIPIELLGTTVAAPHSYRQWEHPRTAATLAGAVCLAVVVLGAFSSRNRRAALVLVALVIVGLAGYAALRFALDYRLVSFLLVPLGALLGLGVQGVYEPLSDRWSVRGSAYGFPDRSPAHPDRVRVDA